MKPWSDLSLAEKRKIEGIAEQSERTIMEKIFTIGSVPFSDKCTVKGCKCKPICTIYDGDKMRLSTVIDSFCRKHLSEKIVGIITKK